MIGLYVVVNGVPSVGVQVMVGSGKIEQQPLLDVEALPASSTVTATPDNNGGGGSHPGAASRSIGLAQPLAALMVGLFGAFTLL